LKIAPQEFLGMSELFAFASRHPTLSLLFVGVGVAWVMWEIGQMRRGYRGLSSNELSLWINRRDAAVIDLCNNNDYLKGHIPGAINLGAAELAEDKTKSLNREKPVVVYDRNGMDAPKAAATLKAMGFKEVAYLDGGLDTWLRDALPVVKGR
jgi:rhodanese-related sulfurtransferase